MVSSQVSAASIYEAHSDMVYHLCLRLGGSNITWAEDATHDVFVKLLEQISALTDRDDLGSWLYKVTVNTCMTRLKREVSIWHRVRRAFSASSESVDHQTPERRARIRQDLDAALREIERLPPKERVVFCMKHLDKLPQQEIAATLNLSEGYVSKLLSRAQQRLERRLAHPSTMERGDHD